MQDYVPQDKKLEIYIIKVLGKCNKSVLEGCCKSAIKCGCTKSDTRMYQERYFCNRNWGIFLCTLWDLVWNAVIQVQERWIPDR